MKCQWSLLFFSSRVPGEMSESEVQTLLNSVERYEQSSISVLEEYVKTSVSRKQHNLEANLALVKLYQFYPQQLNFQILTLILAQSLLHQKEQAFNLVLFMLPERLVCPFHPFLSLTLAAQGNQGGSVDFLE